MSDAGAVALARPRRRSSWLQRVLRARVLELLRGMPDCALQLREDGQSLTLATPAPGSREPLRACLRVHDPAFYHRTALNGSVGAAEAYMDGLWDCDDLVALVRILVRNRDRLDAMERGPARAAGALMRAAAALRRNTHAGSRRNIAAHYDLGNDFFRLFLDENLMYSAALFVSDDEALEVASARKLERICEKLELSPRTRVIEIGSGWGGFAMHAARHTAVMSRRPRSRASSISWRTSAWRPRGCRIVSKCC